MSAQGVRYRKPPSFVLELLYGLLPQGKILAIGSGEDHGDAGSQEQSVFLLDLQVPATGVPERLIIADAIAAPFENSIFDGILAKDVLEHTSDPITVLKELHRITRAGGRTVLTVPQAKPKAVWDDPTHVRGFTRRAIESAAHASGWRVQRMQPIDSIRGVSRVGIVRRNFLRIWSIPGASRFSRNWLAVLVKDD